MEERSLARQCLSDKKVISIRAVVAPTVKACLDEVVLDGSSGVIDFGDGSFMIDRKPSSVQSQHKK